MLFKILLIYSLSESLAASYDVITKRRDFLGGDKLFESPKIGHKSQDTFYNRYNQPQRHYHLSLVKENPIYTPKLGPVKFENEGPGQSHFILQDNYNFNKPSEANHPQRGYQLHHVGEHHVKPNLDPIHFENEGPGQNHFMKENNGNFNKQPETNNLQRGYQLHPVGEHPVYKPNLDQVNFQNEGPGQNHFMKENNDHFNKQPEANHPQRGYQLNPVGEQPLRSHFVEGNNDHFNKQPEANHPQRGYQLNPVGEQSLRSHFVEGNNYHFNKNGGLIWNGNEGTSDLGYKNEESRFPGIGYENGKTGPVTFPNANNRPLGLPQHSSSEIYGASPINRPINMPYNGPDQINNNGVHNVFKKPHSFDENGHINTPKRVDPGRFLPSFQNVNKDEAPESSYNNMMYWLGVGKEYLARGYDKVFKDGKFGHSHINFDPEHMN